jgi:hypothetical protein
MPCRKALSSSTTFLLAGASANSGPKLQLASSPGLWTQPARAWAILIQSCCFELATTLLALHSSLFSQPFFGSNPNNMKAIALARLIIVFYLTKVSIIYYHIWLPLLGSICLSVYLARYLPTYLQVVPVPGWTFATSQPLKKLRNISCANL